MLEVFGFFFKAKIASPPQYSPLSYTLQLMNSSIYLYLYIHPFNKCKWIIKNYRKFLEALDPTKNKLLEIFVKIKFSDENLL